MNNEFVKIVASLSIWTLGKLDIHLAKRSSVNRGDICFAHRSYHSDKPNLLECYEKNAKHDCHLIGQLKKIQMYDLLF